MESEAGRAWRLSPEGRARRAANQRAYRRRHKDRVKAQQASWLEKHPTYERDRGRRRYAEDPARQLAASALWRERHPEKMREYARAFNKTPKARAGWARRRARERSGRTTAPLTAAEWAAILAHYDGRCAYCFVVLYRPEMDHVVPLTKGGPHTAGNVVPACRCCNGSKGNRALSDWLFPRKGGQ